MHALTAAHLTVMPVGMLVQKDLRFLALTASNVVLRELAVGNFKGKA